MCYFSTDCYFSCHSLYTFLLTHFVNQVYKSVPKLWKCFSQSYRLRPIVFIVKPLGQCLSFSSLSLAFIFKLMFVLSSFRKGLLYPDNVCEFVCPYFLCIEILTHPRTIHFFRILLQQPQNVFVSLPMVGPRAPNKLNKNLTRWLLVSLFGKKKTNSMACPEIASLIYNKVYLNFYPKFFKWEPFFKHFNCIYF